MLFSTTSPNILFDHSIPLLCFGVYMTFVVTKILLLINYFNFILMYSIADGIEILCKRNEIFAIINYEEE